MPLPSSAQMNTQLEMETVFRESYGRLLAYLAVRTGDVTSAEDALSDALVQGLRDWPENGVPTNPSGWLLTVAKRRWIDRTRHDLIHEREAETLRSLLEEAQLASSESGELPDERLNLLFVCAHPAIDASIRTPLMLQTVLGLDAARIAGAFLTSPTTMGQRLVRAKTKIRSSGIPFRVPDRHEWQERVAAVLDAIYAAYTAGWDSCQIEEAYHSLASEAISLCRLLVHHLPEEPEARGLLALMLYAEARRPARFSEDGSFIPLLEQDPKNWIEPLMAEAESHLKKAAKGRQPGRYQLEAAIQSVHAERRFSRPVSWKVIIGFYDALLSISDSIGANIGRAAALAQDGQALAALTALDVLPEERVRNHQPYWATRGHVLQSCGKYAEAQAAWQHALGLTEQQSLRNYLALRLEENGGKLKS